MSATNRFYFGVGAAVATPFGPNAAGSPSPTRLATLQDVTVDVSASMKELYGQLQYPVAVARTAGKVSIKAKFAEIQAKAINDLFFGATVGATQNIGVIDEAHAAAASVTITPPNSGTWVEDQGVLDHNGNQMVLTTTAPAVGSYEVSVAGVYTFNAAETGTLKISYIYSIATGKSTNVTNKPMGAMPTFELWLTNSQFGSNLAFKFPSVIAAKLAFNFKNEDFTVPDFECGAFADTLGNIFYFYSDN